MSDSNMGAGALSAANRQPASITQAIFIDARVPDLAILLHGVAADAAVYVLAPDRDGVRQIADILAAEGLCDLNAVSIVAHGVPGALEIGDTRLDAGALRGYAQPLGQIGASLASDGSVLLYACDVGRGASGARFVADLSRLLDANIAAASHPVGASMLGGSFDLDVSIGAIGAAKPFAARSLAAFGGLLIGGAGGANGGAGGSDSPTGVGGGGGNSPGSGDLGAGGGGAGAIGGRGGQGFLAGGGAGGAFPGAAGANGANAGGTNGGGGGGGGGAHRFVGGALPVASATGGNGGNGGGGSGLFGNGGGGGAGGFGAVVTGGGALGTLGVAVTGGTGGAGGNASFYGGNGGSGGTGLLLNAAGATLTVNAAVTGGAGGAGGAANPQLSGSAGYGGAGLVGGDVSITVGPAGSLTGGLFGNGATRADAIFLTGGTNTLTFNHAGTSGLTGNIAVIGSLDFAQGNGVDTTLSNVITGAGSVSKSGANKVTLSGINSYAGATTVNGGTLALSGSGSLATSSKVDVANAAGTFDISATTAGATVTSLAGVANSHVTLGAQTLTLSNAIDTYAGIIQGTGGLALTAGTLSLTGSNTYTGATTVNGGTLALSGSGSIATSSKVDVANAAGTFDISATTAGAAVTSLAGVVGSHVTLGARTLTLSNAADSYAGMIQGTGGLTLTAGTLSLTGSNTYTGATTVNGGTLSLSGGAAIADAGAVVLANVAGATLELSSTETIGSLSGGGAAGGNVQLNANTLTVGANNANTTFDGVISGIGGALVKQGSGVLTLSATNTYDGATTVNAGTLQVDGSIAGSSTTVKGGGTLGGTGAIGAVTVQSGGTLSPGNSPGVLDTGSLTLTAGAHFKAEIGGTTPGDGAGHHDQVNVTGTVNLGGATLDASLFGGFNPEAASGTTYVIINNDGADTVTGTFTSLAEGAQLTIGGSPFTISYQGGSNNNDVVLTAVNDAPTFAVGPAPLVTSVGIGASAAFGLALLTDGKIMLAGDAGNGTDYDFARVRYNADLTIDVTYSGDGKAVTQLRGEQAARAVAFDPSSNKILLAGTSLDDFAVARFHSNSFRDVDFGSFGDLVMTDIQGSDAAFAIAIQPDGMILVAGHSGSDPSEPHPTDDFAVVRYTTAGALDQDFGSFGIATREFGADAVAHAIALQSDGGIVLAGSFRVAGTEQGDFALARFHAEGHADTSFDVDGRQHTDIGGIDVAWGALVQTDGKIVAVGESTIAGVTSAVLVRYNADGSLDSAFGSGGIATTRFGAASAVAFSVALQADGKLVIAGSADGDFAVARFNTAGTLDTSFDGDGIVVTSNPGFDEAHSVVVQPDGRIVVAGQATHDFAVMRYNANGSIDGTVGAVNTLDGAPTFTEEGTAVVLDADVKVYDAELAAQGYSGATLTLARDGGASSQDAFSGSGLLGALTAGQSFSYNGNVVGSVQTNSGGTLVLTFNASATQSAVNGVMQSIAYRNTSEAPPASAKINWIFYDGAGEQVAGSTTVGISSVNDAPQGSDNSLTLAEDTSHSLTAAQFGFSDPVDGSAGAANNFASVIITSLPTVGSLTLSGAAVSAGQSIAVASIPGLMFTPAPNASGQPYPSFTFQVVDDGGVANGGVNTDPNANTFTFDVTPVNDAPVVSGPVTLAAIDEDSGARLITQAELLANASDVDGPPLVAANLTIATGIGSLVDNGNQTWSYTPAANDDTSVTFSYQVTDGIAPPVGGSATLDLTPQNDQPAITSNGGSATATVAMAENSTAVTTVMATDPDGPSLAFSIVGGSDAGKFRITATTGALSFISAPNFESPADADANNSYVVLVRASDSAASDDQLITVNVTDAAPEGMTKNDFNGDARSDILWQNVDRSPAVWLMDGTGVTVYGPALANLAGPSWHAKDAGDFNGDGKADILWQTDSGAPAVWLMNGTSVVEHGPPLPNPGAAWEVIDAADFNGDGRADILWQNNDGTAGVWLMNGTSVQQIGGGLANPGPSWHAKASDDFNGDGKADILWQNDNGTPAVWLMDGVNVLSTGPALTNPGASWQAEAAGDFNGDGKADILWQNDNGTPAVWLMDGTSVVSTGGPLSNPGPSWHVKEAIDANGDGKADILWQNDNGTPAVWLMDGTSVLHTGGTLPNPGVDWHIV